MDSKLKWWGFLGLVLFLFGCTQSPPAGSSGLTPSIMASNQDFSNGGVLVDSVVLDQPGFVVIHQVSNGGTPGTVVGTSAWLDSGSYSNVAVTLSSSQSDAELIAMLHYDNGDRVYSSLDEDRPVVLATTIPEESVVVLQKFLNTANIGNRESPTGTLQVTVKDPRGNLLENAVVDIFLEEEGQAADEFQFLGRQNTNASGVTEFLFVPLGEIYVSAADSANAFQAMSGEIDTLAGQTVSLELTLAAALPEPEPPAPQAIEFSLESDDSSFYQNGSAISELQAPANASINLTITQRTANSAFGGADFKSSAFATFNIPNGQTKTVSFQMPASGSIQIRSFWPSSSVPKADLALVVQ